MKKICALFAMLVCFATTAGAAPVLIGEIAHDYGSATGKIDPSGTDALSPDYVTVSDGSSLRFSDAFNFSGLNYQSVSYFEVILDFAQTNSPFESWSARPGQSTDLPTLTRVGNVLSTQTFTFGSDVNTFASAVSMQTFNLWFAEQGLHGNNFQLYDATLAVFGEPASVPEPSAFALLSVGLLAMGAISYRRI